MTTTHTSLTDIAIDIIETGDWHIEDGGTAPDPYNAADLCKLLATVHGPGIAVEPACRWLLGDEGDDVRAELISDAKSVGYNVAHLTIEVL